MVSFSILGEFGRDSGQSLDAVRIGSNLDQRPPTTSSGGHESRRWRKGAAAPRDAEIIHQSSIINVFVDRALVADVEEYSRDVLCGEAVVQTQALVEGCIDTAEVVEFLGERLPGAVPRVRETCVGGEGAVA